jgi:hypothetical protein
MTLTGKVVAAVNDIGERFVVDIVSLLPFSTTPAKINNPLYTNFSY